MRGIAGCPGSLLFLEWVANRPQFIREQTWEIKGFIKFD